MTLSQDLKVILRDDEHNDMWIYDNGLFVTKGSTGPQSVCRFQSGGGTEHQVNRYSREFMKRSSEFYRLAKTGELVEIWYGGEEADHLFIKIDGVLVDKMPMVKRCNEIRKHREDHFHRGNLQ